MKLRKILALGVVVMMVAAMLAISTASANAPVAAGTTIDLLNANSGAWANVQNGITFTGGTGGTDLVVTVPSAGNSVWLDLRSLNLTLAEANDAIVHYTFAGGEVCLWFVTNDQELGDHDFDLVFTGAWISSIVTHDGAGVVPGSGTRGVWDSEREGTEIDGDYPLMGIIVQVFTANTAVTVSDLRIVVPAGSGNGGTTTPPTGPATIFDIMDLPTTNYPHADAPPNAWAMHEGGPADNRVSATISREGNVWTFATPSGWPSARFILSEDDRYTITHANAAQYRLYFNIEVTSGASFVFQTASGEPDLRLNQSFVSNQMEHLDRGSGDITHAYTYVGNILLSDLFAAQLAPSRDEDATAWPAAPITVDITITGLNIFPVGNDVIVRELRIVRLGGGTTPPPATTPPTTTTPTTTVSPTGTPNNENPKTFDAGMAMVILTGLAGAGGAAIAFKKKK